MRMLSFFARALAFTVMALAVPAALVLAGAWWTLDRPSGRDWLRPRIEAQVSDALDARVEIAEVTSLGLDGARLGGVRIAHAGRPLLDARSARVGLTVVGWLPPVLALAVEIDVFRLDLVRDEDGRVNLVEMFSSDDGAPPPAWLLAVDLALDHGDVSFSGLASEALRFAEVSARGVVKLSGTAAPLIAIDHVAFAMGEASRVRASGWIGLAGAPSVELEIGADPIAGADVAALLPAWSPGRDVRGWSELRGAVDAPSADVHLDAGGPAADLWISLGAPEPSDGSARRLQASFVFRDVDPRSLDERAPEGSVAGAGDVSAMVSGRDVPSELAGDLRLWHSRSGGVEAEWLTAQVRREGDEIVASAQASSPGATWRGSADARMAVASPYAASVDLTAAVEDPGALLPEWKVELGDSSFRLRGAGKSETPFAESRVIEATLDLAQSRVRGVAVDEAQVQLRLDPLLLDLRDLRLRAGTSDLAGSGWMDLREPRALGASATANLDASWLSGARGRVRASAVAWGSSSDLAGRLDAKSTGVLTTRAGTGEAAATVDVSGLGGSSPRARTTLTGRWPLPPSLVSTFGDDVQDIAAHLDWERRPAKHGSTPKRALAPAREREAGSSGQPVEQPTDALRLRLDASSSDARAQKLIVELERTGDQTRGRLTELRLSSLLGPTWSLAQPAGFAMSPAGVEIDAFSIGSASGRITVDGELDRAGRASSRLEVGAHEIDLALACKLAQLGACAGLADGRIFVASSDHRPDVKGNLEISRLEIGGQAYGAVSFDARTEGDLLVNGRMQGQRNGGFSVGARLPLARGWPLPALARDRAIDVRVVGEDIHVAGLRSLAPPATFLELRGHASANVRITGTLDDPALAGEAQATGLVVGLAATGATLRNGRARLRLDGERIVVEELTASDGALAGSGSIDLAGAAPARLDVEVALARLVVVDRPEVRAHATGDLRLSGTFEAPEIVGAVLIDPAMIRPSLVPGRGAARDRDPTIVVVRSPEDAAALDASPPLSLGEMVPDPAARSTVSSPSQGAFLDRLRLSVELRLGESVFIRRTDADIQLAGAVYATKAAGDPLRLTGQIASNRGWYLFQGRRLSLDHAYVSFSGETPIDPYLDIDATYRSPDYLITVAVSGTIGRPTLDLRSQPPLDQSDILSVLLFGKPSSELTAGQGQGLQQQALGLLASYVAPELERSVVDTLGLTSLTFQMPTGSTAGTLGIGRYFGDDVFVSVAQDFGGPQGGTSRQLQGLVGSSVVVQYYLTPSVTLQGAASSQGESAVDVIWQKRY